MKTERKGFQIDAKRPSSILSMAAFACSIPLQIMGYADRLHEPVVALMLVVLPVLCAALMIAVMLRYGRDALWLSVLPVFLGVVSFFYKLVVDPRGTTLVHHIAAVALYALIVILWALTVFYVIRTKWVVTILFLIPFAIHILMNDIPVLLGIADPVSSSIWLKEFSMLFLMLGLSLCAMSFEAPEQAQKL